MTNETMTPADEYAALPDAEVLGWLDMMHRSALEHGDTWTYEGLAADRLRALTQRVSELEAENNLLRENIAKWIAKHGAEVEAAEARAAELDASNRELAADAMAAGRRIEAAEAALALARQEWTDEQCLAFAATAFRHAPRNLPDGVTLQDIRFGARRALLAPADQGES